MGLPAGIYAQIRSPDVLGGLWDSSTRFGRPPASNGSKFCACARRHYLIKASLEGGKPENQSSQKQSDLNGHATEVSAFNKESGVQVWERMGALVRLSYGIGIYGVMALAGKGICCFTGADSLGGLNLCTDAAMDGLGYAVPPMMLLLFILDDEVVKFSPYARAIRDVEDEELMNFFLGMSPWQFLLIVTASSVGEELFYRVAVQGGLAHVFLSDTWPGKDTEGVAALTGMLPFFVPFAQVFAAVLTAALTGSLYYVLASPQDPTYVVAPVPRSHRARQDIRKCFAGQVVLTNYLRDGLICRIAWYERRQMKKIYSPLLESLLALYLGFEWIQTNNILAPIITHALYSAIVLGHGLWRIHDHREKLRQRIRKVWQREDIKAKHEP